MCLLSHHERKSEEVQRVKKVGLAARSRGFMWGHSGSLLP